LKIFKIGERKNKMCAVVLKRTWCSVRARCLFDSGIRGAKHLFRPNNSLHGQTTDGGETGDVRQEHGEESKGRKRSGPTETTLDENKWGARAHRDSVRDFSKGVF